MGTDSPVERSRRCLAPEVRGFLNPHGRPLWRPKMIRLVTRGTTDTGGRTWKPFGWFCQVCGRLELDQELDGPMHFGSATRAP